MSNVLTVEVMSTSSGYRGCVMQNGKTQAICLNPRNNRNDAYIAGIMLRNDIYQTRQ